MFFKKLLCGKKSKSENKFKTFEDHNYPDELLFDIQMDNIQGKNFKNKDTFLKILFPGQPPLETHYVYENLNP